MTFIRAFFRALAVACHLRERNDPAVSAERIHEAERLDRLRNPEKYRGQDAMNG
jgi:hypothetical protein